MDFVLGDMDAAIEVKGGARVHEGDLRGLSALRDSHRVQRAVVVCLEKTVRRVDAGIEVLPWKMFVEQLWSGDDGAGR